MNLKEVIQVWQYNYDYLCHSSHKYIDKTYKNGRWQYTYPQDLKGGRDTSRQTIWDIPNTGQKRKALITKRNVQNLKDSAYATRSKMNKTAEKAAKQAEEEHSSKGKSYTKDVEEYRKKIQEASKKYGEKSDEAFKIMKEAIEYLSSNYFTNQPIKIQSKR